MNNHLPVGLFDMDGSTFDFMTPLYELIQQEKTLPEHVRTTLSDRENRTTIQLRKLFTEDMKEQAHIKDVIEGLYQTQEFFEKVKPYPGIIETLNELNEICYVKFCTKPSKRPCGSESAKRATIIKYFGKEWNERMITTHDKTEIRGAFLADDTPNIIGTYNPEWHHIIVDQPHNRLIEGPRLFLDRQDMWKEIISEILLKKQQ